MNNNKLIVSYAPHWHDGSRISTRNINIMIAAFPALIVGVIIYGMPALSVVTLSIGSAMLAELLINLVARKELSIDDGSAAVSGLLLGMLLPASAPWWLVVIGAFAAIIIGKQLFGGIGANPLNPTLIGFAIIMISWKGHLNFDEALLNYDPGFVMAYPLAALKHFGVAATDKYDLMNLLIGKQSGGIGAVCGLGLLIGGIYLILRGFIRWEISLSFLVGVLITAFLFNIANPEKYASPMFHLLTGNVMLGAFFLATDDTTSPVNFIPMLIFGLACGIMTVLIRCTGLYYDGVVFAILLMNIINPLLDKISPKAIGKVVENA
ncbi:MAG: RnfABCDGE type electron transport complex subunit D [Thermodesulfobacteriota bacterium]|nr:RnfABCDGE type electron transport complex subunit D [Thermodesulfobacteriota bacterium]